MIEVAEVRIWNKQVGAVYWDKSSGYASFEYDPNFLKLGLDLAPIKMSLREARSGNTIFSFPNLNQERFKGLPGMLSDSLPDKFGTQLLDRWLARKGSDADSINPIDRLCFTGKRGMGALEYKPAQEMFDNKNNHIEVDQLVRLAREVLAERKQLRANLNGLDEKSLIDLIQVGTSAGGARAKAVIAYNKSTGDVRSGQTDNLTDYDYWMIKLDGVSNRELGDPENHGKIEYAYHKMAIDCGINMSECDLKLENNRAHFMTKRFDREGHNKIHMQTLCSISHFDYNQPGAYSYEQAFQVLRTLNLPYGDSEELFRRMCFNVVARNQDDHTKNISFLMDKNGKWKLSPAYDMTHSYNPTGEWTNQHQMSINGKRDDFIRDDFIEMAANMNIKKPTEILDEVTDVVSHWSKYAKSAGIDPARINAIQKTLALSL